MILKLYRQCGAEFNVIDWEEHARILGVHLLSQKAHWGRVSSPEKQQHQLFLQTSYIYIFLTRTSCSCANDDIVGCCCHAAKPLCGLSDWKTTKCESIKAKIWGKTLLWFYFTLENSTDLLPQDSVWWTVAHRFHQILIQCHMWHHSFPTKPCLCQTSHKDKSHRYLACDAETAVVVAEK